MEVALFIDTTSNKEIQVGLVVGEEKFVVQEQLSHQKAQVVLPWIERLLTQHNLELSAVKKIEVTPGPGSFTGVRVGLSIANTLGFLLKVPVNEKAVGEMVEAVYS